MALPGAGRPLASKTDLDTSQKTAREYARIKIDVLRLVGREPGIAVKRGFPGATAAPQAVAIAIRWGSVRTEDEPPAGFMISTSRNCGYATASTRHRLERPAPNAGRAGRPNAPH